MNRPTATLLGTGVVLAASSLWLFVHATAAIAPNETAIYAAMTGMGLGATLILSITTYLVRFPRHDDK